ncbi:hypothetical protein JRO89_XS01G0020800 [Xanthoceras sorbifolium]|uniref:MATH domain-containing protein n=1 Tax=Xanthoceras sorbifolium TaxID=99658 RepID=A0ABQ8IHT3_9ROSI|nr:hypothetical protein JRO89_XS01G0020800 [Xanthoceras sorbifolium]
MVFFFFLFLDILREEKDFQPAPFTLKIESYWSLLDEEERFETSNFDVGGYKWYMFKCSSALFIYLFSLMLMLKEEKLELCPKGYESGKGKYLLTLNQFVVDSCWFDSEAGWGFNTPLKDINELSIGYLKDDTLIVEVEFDAISSIKVRP